MRPWRLGPHPKGSLASRQTQLRRRQQSIRANATVRRGGHNLADTYSNRQKLRGILTRNPVGLPGISGRRWHSHQPKRCRLATAPEIVRDALPPPLTSSSRRSSIDHASEELDEPRRTSLAGARRKRGIRARQTCPRAIACYYRPFRPQTLL